MKITTALIALAFGACAGIQTASASDPNGQSSVTTLSQSQDFSAQKKRKRQPVYVYPDRYAYYYPYAFAPADPSWQSPELRRLRALNRCVIDLGYGRWENCD